MYDVQIIWWLPLAGTVVWMAMGFIWYHPKVMGDLWMEKTGLTMEILEARIESGEQNMGLAMGSSLVAGLVMNFVLLHIAQYGMYATETWGIVGGVTSAAWCWLGFQAVDVGMHGFEGRTWKLYFVDKGWMLVAILISGVMIGYFVTPPA